MRSSSITICPICGTENTTAPRLSVFDGQYCQIKVHLESVEMLHCSSCGEDFLSKAQSIELSRRIKSAAREHLGVLATTRIVAIRKMLGLTQTELERLLGVGPKVVTRWESGRVVPGKTTDVVLRLLERHPELVADLRLIQKEAGSASAR